MTTYSAVGAGEVGHKKPLTVSLVRKLIDNVLAMFEGAAGAPRMLGEAAARPGLGLPVLTVAASDAFDLVVGMSPVLGTLTVTGTSFVIAQTWTVQSFTGSVRVRASHVATSGRSYLDIKKNGVSVLFDDNVGLTAVSVDVSIAPGDVITVHHAGNNSTAGSTVSATAVLASNAYVEQPLYRRAV